MVQPEVVFIRRPLRSSWDSFTTTWTPRCSHVPSVPPQNLYPDFEAKTAKPSPSGFEAQSTKPPRVAYSIRVPRHSTRVTAVLDRPVAKSSEPPLNSHVRHLDSVNTVTPPCTLALVDVPKCQPPQLVTWPPGPSVQALCPSFTAPGPSAWHVPTWPSPRRRPPSPSSTPAHHKSRDMLHDPTHAMVNSQTQPKTRITLAITYHRSEPQGHISTLCSHTLNHIIITWPILVQ
jgi:hypothetical protein